MSFGSCETVRRYAIIGGSPEATGMNGIDDSIVYSCARFLAAVVFVLILLS